MSTSDDKYAGTGGIEKFNLFSNMITLQLQAKWGTPAVDVFNGFYRDGKEYFTAERVTVAYKYALGGKSRYEVWYGRKPDLSNMCIKV